MEQLLTFQQSLIDYSQQFEQAIAQYDHTLAHDIQLQTLIDDYSRFIIDPYHKEQWQQLQTSDIEALTSIMDTLRIRSARCVAIMEKYRALHLLEGQDEKTDYFKNIESCIEQEFGGFHVTSLSKVVMIGSGSFPMTPMLIARRTGAKVVGIDIDQESIDLGQAVIDRLGSHLDIELKAVPIEQLEGLQEATHIIFSSTVAEKYDILDRLYLLTNQQVVVAMRYGNGLKSLFNFPSLATDPQKWQQVENIVHADQVFDIAIYQKGVDHE